MFCGAVGLKYEKIPQTKIIKITFKWLSFDSQRFRNE